MKTKKKTNTNTNTNTDAKNTKREGKTEAIFQMYILVFEMNIG